MSLEILLQCFRNGEPVTFKRALYEEIFGRNAIDFRLPLTGVNYADKGGAEIYGADVQNLMFGHFGGKTSFNALYELARQTKSVVLTVTEGHRIAVTDQETIADLPWGFADGLSSPVIVSSGRDLAACLYSAG